MKNETWNRSWPHWERQLPKLGRQPNSQVTAAEKNKAVIVQLPIRLIEHFSIRFLGLQITQSIHSLEVSVI